MKKDVSVVSEKIKHDPTMQFKLYVDIYKFYNDTHDVLMRHETQNLIPLGNNIIGNGGKDKTDWRDPINCIYQKIGYVPC